MATADDDINELYGWVMKFARLQLVKHGEFYPFGAAMTSEGQIQPQMASNGEEHPKSHDLIVMLVEGLRSDAAAGKIRAATLVIDKRIDEPERTGLRDAIEVVVEHRDGESLLVYHPYKKESDDLLYDEPYSITNTERNFFG